MLALSGRWMRLCQVESPLQESDDYGSHFQVCITFCKVGHGTVTVSSNRIFFHYYFHVVTRFYLSIRKKIWRLSTKAWSRIWSWWSKELTCCPKRCGRTPSKRKRKRKKLNSKTRSVLVNVMFSNFFISRHRLVEPWIRFLIEPVQKYHPLWKDLRNFLIFFARILQNLPPSKFCQKSFFFNSTNIFQPIYFILENKSSPSSMTPTSLNKYETLGVRLDRVEVAASQHQWRQTIAHFWSLSFSHHQAAIYSWEFGAVLLFSKKLFRLT